MQERKLFAGRQTRDLFRLSATGRPPKPGLVAPMLSYRVRRGCSLDSALADRRAAGGCRASVKPMQVRDAASDSTNMHPAFISLIHRHTLCSAYLDYLASHRCLQEADRMTQDCQTELHCISPGLLTSTAFLPNNFLSLFDVRFLPETHARKPLRIGLQQLSRSTIDTTA